MSDEFDEIIPAALAGERLDRIVSLVAEISRSEASHAVESGGVTVDGAVVTSGKVRLSEGQRVTVDTSSIPVEELPRADSSVAVRVIHVDDHVIVVNKAPGVVVHPAPGHREGTLVNGLLALFPEIASVGNPTRPGIVHRLDVGTSGLLVVARSDEAYHALVEALSDHDVDRHYTALAWGHFAAPRGTIDAAIGRDPRDPLRMAVVANGKPARTHYEVIGEFTEPEVSLVACQLETGRTHQIRVHLAAAGHPVVGDSAYGGHRVSMAMNRPFLHAGSLSFAHPVTGEILPFTVELPDDLQEILARCH